MKYYDIADKFIYFLFFTCKIKKMIQIEQNILNNFIIDLQSKKNLSRSTSNLLKASINAFIVFLCKQYCFCKLKTFKSSKLNRSIYPIMEDFKMLKLFKKIDPDYKKIASWVEYRNFAMIMILYSTGIRISELIKMSLSDIQDGWLRIDNSKNAVSRVVPVNDYMLIAIENYKDMCPYIICNVVWFKKNGEGIQANAASKSIKVFSGYSAHH